MMKNAFLFYPKSSFCYQEIQIFVLIFLFGPGKKWIDLNDKVNFKIYDVTTWVTNNCNTHIDQHIKK